MASGHFTLAKQSIEERVEHALEVFDDFDVSQKLFLSILEDAQEENDNYGLVKCNFGLGYIEKSRGDFGKATIYYLEGIRYAKEAAYDGSTKDLINMMKNVGTIFLKFQNYELAQKYYDEAISIADQGALISEYVRLMYANSRLQKAQGYNKDAIALLESTFGHFSHISNNTIALIYNELGLLYSEERISHKALDNFNKLLDFLANKEDLRAKYGPWALHNLGNLYFEVGEYETASEHFSLALDQKHLLGDDSSSLFITLKDLGESHLMAGDMDAAERYLNEAQEYYASAKNVPEHYQLFKLLGEVAKSRGDINAYSSFQEGYAKNLESYLEERKQVEASDKKYNLELITQRYFAMVAEQERNQQIVFYSAIGISSLVMTLLLVVSIFYYRKWKLRRDLEQAIRPLTTHDF